MNVNDLFARSKSFTRVSRPTNILELRFIIGDILFFFVVLLIYVHGLKLCLCQDGPNHTIPGQLLTFKRY